MKTKEAVKIIAILAAVVFMVGGLVIAQKESTKVKEINLDYVEKSGLRITPGRVYNRGWNSEYLDVFVGEISQYVRLATELNIKTVYLRESALTFEVGNTIYTANLGSRDPSIDYTERRTTQ